MHIYHEQLKYNHWKDVTSIPVPLPKEGQYTFDTVAIRKDNTFNPDESWVSWTVTISLTSYMLCDLKLDVLQALADTFAPRIMHKESELFEFYDTLNKRILELKAECIKEVEAKELNKTNPEPNATTLLELAEYNLEKLNELSHAIATTRNKMVVILKETLDINNTISGIREYNEFAIKRAKNGLN